MKNIPEFSLKKHPLIIFNHFLSKYIDDISFLNASLLQSKNFDFDTAILGPERAVADIINPFMDHDLNFWDAVKLSFRKWNRQ